MPQTATKESAVRLLGVQEVEDPREVAGALTRELAELTAKRSRLIQGAAESGCGRHNTLTIDRRISQIHAQMHRLANHS